MLFIATPLSSNVESTNGGDNKSRDPSRRLCYAGEKIEFKA
jgi:hypothetical protein